MPNITIFTTNTCGYCGMVKKFLAYKGLTYNEVNLDENPDMRNVAIKLSGQMSVPVTVVEKDDAKEIIVGYNLAKLAPAIA